jgi:hypothetical protein
MGQTANLSGTYYDPGYSDTHSLYIDWDNDGSWDGCDLRNAPSFGLNWCS